MEDSDVLYFGNKSPSDSEEITSLSAKASIDGSEFPAQTVSLSISSAFFFKGHPGPECSVLVICLH